MAADSAKVIQQVLKLIDGYDLYGRCAPAGPALPGCLPACACDQDPAADKALLRSVAYPKRHTQADISDIYRLPLATRGVFTNVALQEPFGLTVIEVGAQADHSRVAPANELTAACWPSAAMWFPAARRSSARLHVLRWLQSCALAQPDALGNSCLTASQRASLRPRRKRRSATCDAMQAAAHRRAYCGHQERRPHRHHGHAATTACWWTPPTPPTSQTPASAS